MENKKCKIFEDMILKSTISDLNASEIDQLIQHLSECKACSELQESVSRIAPAVHSVVLDDIKPNPQIHNALRKRLTEKHQPQKVKKGRIRLSINSMLQHRIPVYQAAIAAVVVAFIFNINIIKSNVSKNQSTSAMHYKDISSNSFSSPYFVNNLPSLDSQKVGINAKEDTVLTKFIFTSM